MQKRRGGGRVAAARWTPGLLAVLAGGATALAGGTPENILLVIDPSSPESLYIGNYYKHARGIPDANVLYMDADAAGYAAFVDGQGAGFLGALAQRGLEDHIDYVVVAPGPSFFVAAPGLVTDGCWPVARFSMSSVFTMARITDDVLAGPSSSLLNHYYSTNTNAPAAFDSVAGWRFGSQSGSDGARRYYIGALLGYTGERGNSVPQIIGMIDRSVAADGSSPAGTFYFMNNAADPARNVRSGQFAGAETAVKDAGGVAEILPGVLPDGRHDALGIMTGAASVPVGSADLTLLAGAYAEHLTSYGATFDNGQQTKISAWIGNGASGSSGAVEEPCNYTGKFSHARFHAFYAHGMSLGESYLRTIQYVPFQNLLLGDPMTRPFATFPTADLPGAPTGPVSGTIYLRPTGSTTVPGASIYGYELLIDGVSQGLDLFENGYFIDTTTLSDGWHDLRALAYDSTAVRTAGRWTGSLVVNNHGRSASLAAAPASGTLAQAFTFDVGVAGPGTVSEVRLLQNGRVVAASDEAPASFTLWGHTLGAGGSTVQPEILYADGRTVRGEPEAVSVSFTGTSGHAAAPVAFGYTKIVSRPDEPFVVELPAAFDGDPSLATYTVVSGPAQSTVAATGAGAFRVLIPGAGGGACGADELTFRVETPGGQSNLATVTIAYGEPTPCRADFNGNQTLDVGDFSAFRTAYLAGDDRSDFNGNCTPDVGDFSAFRAEYLAGCP